MPILSGSLGELASELQSFEREHKTAVDKVTASLAASDERHKAAEQRLDSIEEKQRQRPAAQPQGGPGALSRWLNETFERRPPVGLTPGKTLCEIPISGKDITLVSQSFPQQYQAVVPLAQPAVGGVRSLIPSTATSSGAVEYIRELTFTNLAAAVAEAATKPKSDKTFDVQTAVVRTIAHYFKVSKQVFDDLPQLAMLVESNGVYGVGREVEELLLKGDGIAPNLQGIYPLATATATPAAGDTLWDSWFKAVGQLGQAGYRADGIVVSWADWVSASLLKDSQGRYLMGSSIPQMPRIVVSPIMNTGEWLVGDFSRGSHIFERQTITVEVSTSNEDDFIKNLICLRAEERLAHAVWRAAAYLKNAA